MRDEPLFEINQKVKVSVANHEFTGSVCAIYIDANGASFNVQYMDDVGRVQRDYFHASSLTAA